MQSDYQLEQAFYNYYQIFQKIGILSLYPQINKELLDFSQIISHSDKKIDESTETTFSIPFSLFKSSYYHLSWNISLLENYLKIHSHPIFNVGLNDPRIWSDGKLIEPYKAHCYAKQNIDKPIILAYHFPANLFIVIDGNHRFHAAKLRGDRSIRAIILNPLQHLQFLRSDLFKNLYIVHHNLCLLTSIPFLKSYNISTDLGRFSYYPITDNNINFNKLKNTFIRIKIVTNMKTMNSYKMK